LKSDNVPLKIGPYQIERVLARGGMSVLFLSTDKTVVKVLLPKYLENKELAKKFLHEAEVVRRARHPNIVELYGSGVWEKGLYIAMEYIEGKSLRQLKKEIAPEHAREILLQVALALIHLHSHGIIHRDIKPENILVTDTGSVKVIDFGVAALKGEGAGELAGTPIYMSPEQRERKVVTPASDIYSLGCIVAEFLPEMKSVIEKACAPEPLMRYKDVGEFITALKYSV
jgi:eukaryotic-like serine/threonine-protein kinase